MPQALQSGQLPCCMLLGADMTSRQQRQGDLLTAVLVCKVARQGRPRNMCICYPLGVKCTHCHALRCQKLKPQVHPSAAGHPMVPLSWQEMQCPQTKAVEKRKVAKVKA